MNWKQVWSWVRVAVAGGAGFALFRFAESVMSGASGWRPDLAFEIAIALLLYGMLLFALFGHAIIMSVANRFGGLFWPDDAQFRIRPEYSVAEARAKQGRIEEAIEEYCKVVEQFPEDVYPHLRMAGLALEHLHDLKRAELELLSATAKAAGPTSIALAMHRLADFYEIALRQPQRALEVMEQLQARLPGTKEAELAAERMEILRRLAAGEPRSMPPEKIAYRPIDEETLRRRRGF